jgi:phosphohistidine phosphatase
VPQLILMRHGKSDWDAPSGRDRQRPLNERGVASARAMGRVLTLAGQQPDLVLASPAVRAHTTAELAAEAGGWDAEIRIAEPLYPGSPHQLFAVVATEARDANKVLTVGHDPATSETASLLLGDASLRMVTAAVAAFEVPSWNSLEAGSGMLLWMLVPRLFTDGGFDLD